MVKIGSFLISLFLSLALFAEPKVTAFVEESEVSLGDAFTLTVSVTSNDSFEAAEPRIPSLSGMTLVNSWSSSSTSSKLVQGQGGMQFETVRRQDFNYQLAPQSLGNLQIESFEVIVDGKPYFTKPFTIRVVKSAQQKRPQHQQNQIPGMPSLEEVDEAEQMFQQLLQRGFGGGAGGNGLRPGRKGGMPQESERSTPPPANKLNPPNPQQAFFVQVELDKVEAYVGEQITASWYLYTRGNILSLDRLKFPDLKGFWKESIEEVSMLQFENEIINGVPYRKSLLATHALFPRAAGISVVDEYKIKASVQLANGLFGFGQPYTYTRSSDRVQIKVKQLPVDGKPKDFTGAVGQFELRASVDQRNYPMNQPFTLKVRFDGMGNAKNIDLPEIKLPPGVELYDKKNESKFFKNGRSFIEYEVLLIPRQKGDVTIPSISASTFNPSTGRYVTQATDPIHIQVTDPVQGEQSGSVRLQDKGSNRIERKDTLPDILLSYELDASSRMGMMSIAQILIWIVVVTTLGMKSYLEFGRQNKVVDVRAVYKKRMTKIHKLVEQNEWRASASEVSNLIYFILGEISEHGVAANELEKLLDDCPPSIRRDLGASLKAKTDLFQAIGFAPEELVGKYKNKDEFKHQLTEVGELLEKAITLASKE